jgi:hypothetical protein
VAFIVVKLIAHFFVLLAFVTFNDAYGLRYSEDDVTPDFKKMLGGPNSPKEANESFATHVTRPFIAKTDDNFSFFSDPKKSRADWDSKHRAWKSDGGSLNVFDIFKTMGSANRGILNHDNLDYKHISNAQEIGMVKIVSGDLGFSKKTCTSEQEAIMARELLNIGRSMDDATLSMALNGLERAYQKLTAPEQKLHLQISALYMLVGHGFSVNPGYWFTNGINYEGAFESKIKKYAEALPPLEPKNVRIERLLYSGKLQKIFGTPGIKASGLHADVTRGAKFPEIMVLGSNDVPRKQLFSIAAEISKDHYLVVMSPETYDNPVLRPQYMKVKANDPISGAGQGNTDVTVFYADQRPKRLTIDWKVKEGSTGIPEKRGEFSRVEPTEKKTNDGRIDTIISEKDIKDKMTYSFIAEMEGKKFYYWCPTAAQMRLLETDFVGKKQSFTFGELLYYINNNLKTSAVAVDRVILEEISEIEQGRLKNFNN